MLRVVEIQKLKNVFKNSLIESVWDFTLWVISCAERLGRVSKMKRMLTRLKWLEIFFQPGEENGLGFIS